MKVWLVFVKVRDEKQLVARYIDSQWAVKTAAVERKTELERSCRLFGCLDTAAVTGVSVDIFEGSVADAAIKDSPEGMGRAGQGARV